MAIMAAKPTDPNRPPPDVRGPTVNTLSKFSERDRELIERAIEEPVEFVSDPVFKTRNVERDLFPEEPSERRGSISEMLDNPNAVRTAMSTMTAKEERHAFRRFNYARYRVCQVLARHQGRRLTLSGARELVFWHRRVLAARSLIVQGNLPLVLAMAKRTRLNGVDFNELISEGNMALLRSVAKFDCSRGFKFSTYACRAILKSFSRVAMRTTRYRGRFPTEFDPTMEKSDFIETKREEEYSSFMDELRGVLQSNLAELSDVEWTVIKTRFALSTDREEMAVPKTLEEVGQIIGVTKERVRQIQNKALRKLRLALEESMVAA
ncbi:MAG: sigma-70 family RNA polymerase sigma factor [Phycisphaerae bacterium]|nr:sigma-70 family RNA polymerase sigma factor [Phycisphaerae bacterium]